MWNAVWDFLENKDIENKYKLFDKFYDIYNKDKYDFKYDKYKVNNIYKQWKKNTIKLTKYIIFEKKILQIIIMKFI